MFLRRGMSALPPELAVVEVGVEAAGGQQCLVRATFDDAALLKQVVDEILPVDIYISGCPPRPEALIEAVMEIQRKISRREKSASELAGESSSPA